jgi:hypothetical protein
LTEKPGPASRAPLPPPALAPAGVAGAGVESGQLAGRTRVVPSPQTVTFVSPASVGGGTVIGPPIALDES